MAKAKQTMAATVQFIRTGNPWIDAGIVGLYRVLQGKPSYLKSPSKDEDTVSLPGPVQHDLHTDRLVITGPPDKIQACLEGAYDRLIDCYFNVSTQKQISEKSTWNFYYDSQKGSFIQFPKKKAAGAASLLFDKAARPSGKQVAWGTNEKGERTPGVLPPSHARLQPALDKFLAAQGLKPGPPAGLLVDGENQVRPKVEIRVQGGKPRGQCFLVGTPEATLVEAKETAFPLLGGSRSFINGASEWPRMGWQIDFLGKFVPAVAFFYQQGDSLHVFFPESNDLRRVDDLADRLASMVDADPNLFRNFNLLLGTHVQRRSEVALAFLHRVFVELTKAQGADQQARFEEFISRGSSPAKEEHGSSEISEGMEEAQEAPLPAISYQAIFDSLRRRGDVRFTIVSASKKGNVWMSRDFTCFRDIDRLARLFEAMQMEVDKPAVPGRLVCNPRKLYLALVDFEAKPENRTLLRDKVCETIFRRESALDLLERHAFNVNKHSDPGRARPVRPLLDFARLYEVDLHKGTQMETAYRKMVETATWLGDLIGEALASAVKGRTDPDGVTAQAKESPGKAKGGLHRLHKSRTVADFVNELARLQMRYRIDVPKNVMDGETFTPQLFEEFRGFCVVAALNRFQYLTRPQKSSQSP